MPSSGFDSQRNILKIDGNRVGFSTLFNHADHQQRLGQTNSCIKCHHMSLPNDHSTPCSKCHQNMFTETNIFDHENHKALIASNANLGGICPSNQSCSKCHLPDSPKTNESAKTCLECHNEDMFLTGNSNIQFKSMMAVSYSDAMHLTCMECHKSEAINTGNEQINKCFTCHESLRKVNSSEYTVNMTDD